jgi:hypothetical protein
MAAVASYRLSNGVMIAGNQLALFFRIELRCDFGRADQITK